MIVSVSKSCVLFLLKHYWNKKSGVKSTHPARFVEFLQLLNKQFLFNKFHFTPTIFTHTYIYDGSITCAWFDTLTHSTINRVLCNYVFYLNKRQCTLHITQYTSWHTIHPYMNVTILYTFSKSLRQQCIVDVCVCVCVI